MARLPKGGVKNPIERVFLALLGGGQGIGEATVTRLAHNWPLVGVFDGIAGDD